MDDSQLDPALIQQMLGMQDPENDPKLQRMMRQQKMLEAMRGSTLQNSQGRMVGNRFVAPNLATQALNAVALGAGKYREGQMDDQMVQMGADRTNVKSQYLNKLMKAMRARGITPPQEPTFTNSADMPIDDGFQTDPAMGP
jgi:hypothetical protein